MCDLTLPPPPPSGPARSPWLRFSWRQLDGDRGSCGGSKCFFPTEHESQQGQGVGWLVQSQATRNLTGWSAGARAWNWNRAWALAEDLRTRFGVSHLLLGPPRRLALKAEEAALLNANLTQEVRKKHLSARYKEGGVLVQPTTSCAWPRCLMLGCQNGPRASLFKERLAGFLERVRDKARFVCELERNVRVSNAMLNATKCLHVDFQALLRADGTIFHIDLDRCWDPTMLGGGPGQTTANQWVEGCLDGALALVRRAVATA